MLQRAALEARLDECFARRLTLLIAGPGYGKSTLLSAWSSELQCAWYEASSDERLWSLVAGVVAGIRPFAPGLPEDFGATPSAGRHELQAEALDARLAHDVILVLDDMHEAAPSRYAIRFIESLARQAPPTLHIVVAARREL